MQDPKNLPAAVRQHKKFWTRSDIDVLYPYFKSNIVLRFFHVLFLAQLMLHYRGKLLNSDLISGFFTFAQTIDIFRNRELTFYFFSGSKNLGLFFRDGGKGSVNWAEDPGVTFFAIAGVFFMQIIVYYPIHWILSALNIK